MNILKMFQPKDKVFFALFEKVTQNLVEMSEAFMNEVSSLHGEDDSIMKKISDFEHKNDSLTHELFIELGKNFITPFDREDIHALASGLDDIADYIYLSAKYIFLYKSPQTDVYREFASLIHKACLEIQNAVRNLRGFKNFDQVKESCIRVNSIENIADDVLSNAMVKLFETEDPVAIIKAKSVFEYLEEVTDRAEDVANTIETIMIKYS